MRDNFIDFVIKKVFPEGTENSLGGKAAPHGSRFWIIPGKENEPRWIVPDEPRYAWPLLEQWSPYDLPSRIKWKLLKMAYRRKYFAWVPGVIPFWITVPEKSNWEHLGWTHAKPPIPVIYIGRSRHPNRKAVLGLVDSQKNEIISVSKVPLTPSAALAINYEIENLETLANEKPGRAPRAIFTDHDNGIATQEFLGGLPSGRSLTETHLSYLVDLAIPEETTSLHEAVQSLGREIEVQKNITPEDRALLNRALEEADDPSPLPAVWEHGDFAPWNLKNAANGSLCAVDWETSSRLSVPMFDLVHFYSIQAFHFGKKELFTKSFREHMNEYLKRLGISPGMTPKIIRVCILRDWLRHNNEGSRRRSGFLLRTLVNLPGDLE